MRIRPDWQIGAQGAVLIVVLALRALIKLREATMKAVAARLGNQPWLLLFSAQRRLARHHPLHGGRGGGEVITAASPSRTFTVIVGIGQMFVITTGPATSISRSRPPSRSPAASR
jgi:hypothetical protein